MTMTTPRNRNTRVEEPIYYITVRSKQEIIRSHKTVFENIISKLNLFTSTMKLHLLLLASLFNLSSGFMAELRGQLTGEDCTGDEYADFKKCTNQVVLNYDESFPNFTEHEEIFFVNRGGDDRKLNWCNGCNGQAPRGTFCFTVCGGRRLSEEGMDTPNLRRLDQPDFVALFQDGTYTGNNDMARQITRDIIDCIGRGLSEDSCLGSSTDTMKLKVAY
jgi:hypothetical protein